LNRSAISLNRITEICSKIIADNENGTRMKASWVPFLLTIVIGKDAPRVGERLWCG
jgi:hypothetical protein